LRKLVALIKKFYERIEATDVFGLSAQLAYFLLLSLFPFLIFLLTLVGYLPIEFDMIISIMDSIVPDQMMNLINENIYRLLNRQDGGVLSLSIIGTLWAASNGIRALTRAFNRAYRVEENRPFLVSRLIAMVMTIAMVGIIIVSLLLPIYGRIIGEYIITFLGLSDELLDLWNTFRWVLSSVVIFIVLLALYVIAPNTRVYFKNAIWGALFSTVLWQLSSLAFSHYVNTLGNYDATYGSLGAVIVMMVWFYLSGIIIITGGVLNAFIRELRFKKE